MSDALVEKRGDLFGSAAETDSLAHCISEDCHMGAGIAVVFKAKFGGLDELRGHRTGDCAVLRREDRFVYYLVTKRRYYERPTYIALRRSLDAMRDHAVANGVTSIAMPRIGCGLDRLSWSKVSALLRLAFRDAPDVAITVYSLSG